MCLAKEALGSRSFQSDSYSILSFLVSLVVFFEQNIEFVCRIVIDVLRPPITSQYPDNATYQRFLPLRAITNPCHRETRPDTFVNKLISGPLANLFIDTALESLLS